MNQSLKEKYPEELANAINDVIEELNTLAIDKTEYTDLSTVEPDVLNMFLVKNSLSPNEDFKKAMTTPFAIARYLILVVQQKEAIEKVKNTLEILLAGTKINYTIYEDFTNQICFTKDLEINSEEKPQCLVLKYRIDKEEDKVIFVLPGNNWGWDIDNTQLLAILTHKLTPNYSNEKSVQKLSKEDVVLTFNGVDVILKKHN